ncbi:MaoC family dehydratase [Devosia sp. FJ2-5-3]|jgi:3-hydroxybutyryl-CoA dehydratase|uniref:MaoC family dehydratase n=1 Tax=Devosia sp. FJ2-5-3 TaxID=2976680 RepID=UPI0023D7C272|nr:MaoC family dehydratase [Devosia sp. FJ2-5-3]WEJ59766.1 MaoC family dehydratase [Devosia sp. FJ2-5-3]
MASSWTQSVDGLVAFYDVTVSAEDIAVFARLSGDDYEAHTDPAIMAQSSFGGIIAHGALLVGYMSAAGTKAIRQAREKGNDCAPVALGYEGMRFVAPVFPGDALRVSYSVKTIDEERRRSVAGIEITNQSGRVVAVADHIMKWLKSE